MASQLKVAVVHYHLKRGGVTRVIESMEAAFQEQPPGVAMGVITGSPASHESLHTIEVPELGYDDNPGIDPDTLLEKLRQAAAECLGGPPDVWHIHNHSLGKNAAYSAAVSRLAAGGEPVFFHLHDFAEDSRPDNYQRLRCGQMLPEILYPQGNAIAYGVLNGRDYRYLKAAGLNPEQLVLLPNAIPPPEKPARNAFQDWDPSFRNFESLLLYPVRATRRKNFGELLLWATLARHGVESPELRKPLFLSTLGPTNPEYEKRFARWQELVREQDLPVRLGFGETRDLPYPAILGASDAFITTSIAEGFGLGFLEPWLLGKPLLGRDLPQITNDFRKQGIQLNALYDSIRAPLSWIGGRHALRTAVAHALSEAAGRYGRASSSKQVDAALDAMIREDGVDFGALHEDFQEQVLSRLNDHGAIREINPASLPTPPDPATIAENARQIADHYSLAAYGQNLLRIYRNLITSAGTSQTVTYLHPEAVLDQFLDPRQLNLLRSQ